MPIIPMWIMYCTFTLTLFIVPSRLHNFRGITIRVSNKIFRLSTHNMNYLHNCQISYFFYFYLPTAFNFHTLHIILRIKSRNTQICDVFNYIILTLKIFYIWILNFVTFCKTQHVNLIITYVCVCVLPNISLLP